MGTQADLTSGPVPEVTKTQGRGKPGNFYLRCLLWDQSYNLYWYTFNVTPKIQHSVIENFVWASDMVKTKK